MSPAWSGRPDRCEYMSPTVTILRDGRIRQREPRQLRHDRRVPADRVHAHLMGDDGRRPDGLDSDASWNTVSGSTLFGAVLADVLDTEALGVHRLSAVHDGDRHAGDAGLLHQVVGDAVELGDRVVDRVLRQRHGGHQRRRHVGQRRLRLAPMAAALRPVRNRTPPAAIPLRPERPRARTRCWLGSQPAR